MIKKMNISRTSGLAIGAVFMAIGIVLVIIKPEPELDEQPAVVRPAKTFVVGEKDTVKLMRFTGKVKADLTVDLAFEVSGQIVEMLVNKGDVIKKGQVLARLDPRDYQSDVKNAEATYERTKAYLRRIESVIDTGAVSQTDLTNAEADFQSATAKLEIAKKALEDTDLKANFDGIVADKFVDNFQNVKAKEPVLRMQDISTITIEANFPEKLIARYRDRESNVRPVAMFDYLPGEEFELEVKEFALDADPSTQTFLITFKMDPPEDFRLLSGMTASVGLYFDEPLEEYYTIPLDAALIDGLGNYYVWKLTPQEDGVYVAHKKPILPGSISGDMLEVLGGVESGDLVVKAGIHFIEEGQRVSIYKDDLREAK